MRPTCTTDGCDNVAKMNCRKGDKIIYKKLCSWCNTKKYESEAAKKYRNKARGLRARPYVIHKKDRCEGCGFVPVHSCQLDVDHIDGNHSNNEEDNLQTLCANCHRLKTHLCGDNAKQVRLGPFLLSGESK